VLAAAVAVLAGCGNGDSAVETRDRSADTPQALLTSGPAPETAAPAASAEAAPILTANRRETVDAKTARLFERNGADFDAATPEAYLAKVRAFTQAPP